MRKFLTLGLTILMLFATTGCSLWSNGAIKYEIFILDYSCGFTPDEAEKDYIFSNTIAYTFVSPKKQMDIFVNGKKQTGIYVDTEYRLYNYYPCYNYMTDDGVTFAFDDKGMLVDYYEFGHTLEESDEQKVSQDEIIKIATKFISPYADVSDYKTEIEDLPETKMYRVKFVKYVDEQKTCDHASILIFYDGWITSYTSSMLGRIPNDIEIDDISFEEVESLILEKLNDTFDERRSSYDVIKYENLRFELLVLKDGKRALVCDAKIDQIKFYGDVELHDSVGIKFLVKCN